MPALPRVIGMQVQLPDHFSYGAELTAVHNAGLAESPTSEPAPAEGQVRSTELS